MRKLAYYWGVLGVAGIITSAVVRLSPRMFELGAFPFDTWHWATLLLFTPYMAWAEGYKGFHLNFAPRVVVRAQYLRTAQAPLHTLLLAPLFCMGFFHATRRRMRISIMVTAAIVVLVLVVSRTAQPWRGIIDTGVVTGLVLGTASLLWHWLKLEFTGQAPAMQPDLPEEP